jgi:hypothetical protein
MRISFELLPKAPAHPTEDLLEEYSFGRVDEPALADLEEHLLICVSCQIRLEEVDEYKALMKSATSIWEQNPEAFRAGSVSEFGNSEFRNSRKFAISWIPGARVLLPSVLVAAILIAVLVSRDIPWRWRLAAPATRVTLTAMRGGGSNGGSADGLAQAPSGNPLDLAIDGANLPPARGYHLNVVNQSGHEIWSGPAIVNGTQLSAHIAAGPRSGVYWIRLYSSSGDFLREFGMRLE